MQILQNLSSDALYKLGEWSSTTPYVTGDITTYSGQIYVALGGTTGSQPDTNPSDWRIYTDTLPYDTVTDPALNAAATTAIIDAYGGIIITTTTTGNNQTISAPTDTSAGRKYTIVNDDTSTDAVSVIDGTQTIAVNPGEAQSYVWDGSAWCAVTAVDATNITFTPTGDISSTNVQSAIAEVDLEKEPIVDGVQVYYVGKHGNDSNDGLTNGKAFLTFTAAIAAAVAQTPSSTNQFSIVCHDAGIYSEGTLLVTSYISIDAPSATFKASSAVNVMQLSENTLVRADKIIQDQGGPAAVVGANDTGVKSVIANVIQATGASTAVVNYAITSAGKLGVQANLVYVETGKAISDNSADGLMGLDIGGIYISGNGGTGIFSGGTGAITGKLAFILELGTPTTTLGIDVNAGTVNLTIAKLITDTAYDVESGASLNMHVSELAGTELNDGSAEIINGSSGISITGAITTTSDVTAANVNGTSSLQLNGTDINTGATLDNVAYLDQANTFTQDQSVIKASGYNLFTMSTDATKANQFNFQNAGATIAEMGVDNATDAFYINDSGVGAKLTLNIGTGDLYVAGKAGIGISSPGEELDVQGSSAEVTARVKNTLAAGARAASLVVSPQSDDSYALTLKSAGNTGIVSMDKAGTNFLSVQLDGSLVLQETSGNVGIGTTSPQSLLHVLSGTQNTVGDTYSTANITGPNKTFATSGQGIFQVTSNDAQAIDKGGSIAFGGRFTDASTQHAMWAGIQGLKENATSANLAGYLSLGTRAAGDALTEKMRITSTGNVGINSPTPSARLEILEGKIRNTFERDISQTYYGTIQTTDINTTIAAGMGGQIVFGSRWNTSSINDDLCYVGASKTNATAGNYSFDLVFGTRTNGGASTTKMTISDTGTTTLTNGANTNIVLRPAPDSTTYNQVSLKGAAAYGNYVGLAGGATADESLYIDSGNAGNMIFRVGTGSAQVEKFRILGSNGYMGVGTNAPTSELTVKGDGTSLTGNYNYINTMFADSVGGNPGVRLGYDSSTKRGMISPVAQSSAGGLDFVIYDGTSAFNTLMTLNYTNKVGIGQTTPTETLNVKGSFLVEDASANRVITCKTDGRFYYERAQTGSGTNLVISNTDGQILKDSSSVRYKENIIDSTVDSSVIHNIELKEYNYIDSGHWNVSPTAEDMAEIDDRLIFVDKEGRPDAIANTRVMWLMLEEIKKLRIELDELKA